MSDRETPVRVERTRPPLAVALDVCRTRGAILVHTAAMMVGLTAFSAFVVDYGILWTARRQIQNAADAAALAAAYSLAFNVPAGVAGAQTAAINAAMAAAAQNPVWGQPAVVEGSTIAFPACPAGAFGTGPCVRVNAYRNQTHGNPLPTVFGQLVNVLDQGVQATATAQVLWGDTANCVRPMAVPDRWQELNPAPAAWNNVATFSRYGASGNLLAPADYYEPPGGGLFGPNGTGFSREASAAGLQSYGLSIAWGAAVPPYKLATNPEAFLPVRFGGSGAGAFYTAMMSCQSDNVFPGLVLEHETANVDAMTVQAGQDLINLDPGARWDPSLNGGRGGIAGGCMTTGTCPGPQGERLSPRLLALPAFNPDLWDAAPPGSTNVTVTRIVGFFLERIETPALGGRLAVYPVIPRSTMTANAQSSFLASVTLVR